MNDQVVPFVAITDNDLGEKLGCSIDCPRCGSKHAVESSGPSKVLHPDGTESVGPAGTVQFYRCNGTSYIVGIKGQKLWGKR